MLNQLCCYAKKTAKKNYCIKLYHLGLYGMTYLLGIKNNKKKKKISRCHLGHFSTECLIWLFLYATFN